MNPFGPFGNRFPYTNFHDLNLDWVIQIAKDFLDQYTNIQETIEGKTTEGLEALAAEAERLEGLLDAWYTEHSEDIAGQLASAITDFQAAAEAAGAAVLATIPEDYTALSTAVTALSSGAMQSSNSLLDNSSLTSIIASGDLDDLTTDHAVYYCNGLTAATNQPVTTMTGELIVFKFYRGREGGTTQLYLGNNGEMFFRTAHGAEGSITWEDWTRYYSPDYVQCGRAIISESTYSTILPSGDFNNLYADQEIFYCAGLTSASHMPTSVMNGMFMVMKYNPGSDTGLIQIYYGNDGSVFYRTSHGASLSWDTWRQVGAINNDATVRIFRKVICCGDSYTSGYIVDTSNNPNRFNEAYAWPATMERITGNRYINCGVSGANSKTWINSQRGLPAARLAGKSQAYILSLGLNDASSDAGLHLDLGTSDDIGQDVDTYYGRYSQIIRELSLISPQAHIFCTTIPDDSGYYPDYNAAVEAIVTAYTGTYNVHLVDLAQYIDLFKIKSITSDRRGGHYTSIGYEQFGEILTRVISRTINDNLADFIDVNLIPFDSDLAHSTAEMLLNNISPTDLTFSSSYIEASGRYGALDNGDIIFSLVIRMKANVSSGLNNILTELPTPGNTDVMFFEHDLGDVLRPDRYLTYTTGWRLNNKHTAGEYCFYYGIYTPAG